MAMTWRNTCGAVLVGLSIVALLAGCSGRKVTTSAADESLLQKQTVSAAPQEPRPSTGVEAARIVEPPLASIEPPPVARETPSQPVRPSSPAGSSGPTNASRPPAVSALPPGAIEDVYFDYDRFSLRTDARATLEKNARWLKSKNGVKVLVEGHCDERGTLAYNLVLGERRAQSIKRYLQELGIPASQLRIVSYGKERPFCTEHREACWQQNRRGHFVVK